jgi:hypothetical protein
MKVYLQMITKQLFEWNITYKWSLEIISAFINHLKYQIHE